MRMRVSSATLLLFLSACAGRYEGLTKCEQAQLALSDAQFAFDTLVLVIGDDIDDEWTARLELAHSIVDKAQLVVDRYCATPASTQEAVDADAGI